MADEEIILLYFITVLDESLGKQIKSKIIPFRAIVNLFLEYAYAIKEAPVSISCKVKSVTELGSHDMFIGEIVAVTADSYLLDAKGRLCLDNAKLVAYNHGEYFLVGEKLGFFGYSVASADVLKKRMGNK